jgi:hypothetical protein
MKYAKMLHTSRFTLNATHDPSLRSYFDKLKESNPKEAEK